MSTDLIAKTCHECRANFSTSDTTDELCGSCQREYLRENGDAQAEDRPMFRVTLTEDEIEELLSRTAPDAADATVPLTRYAIVNIILRTRDELREASRKYAAASVAFAEATVAESEARLALAANEIQTRATLIRAGLVGSNEATRAAFLADALIEDGDLELLRNDLEAAHELKVMAEHEYRVADQLQKGLRVQLAALVAVAPGE